MLQRVDPYAVAPESMEELIAFHEVFETGSLEQPLLGLVRVRVSQLNRCQQGVVRHCRDTGRLGESMDRLTALNEWRARGHFTAREKAALAWAEIVTSLSDAAMAEEGFKAVREWFSDEEIVRLTIVVAATNAWNRVEWSLARDSRCVGESQEGMVSGRWIESNRP